MKFISRSSYTYTKKNHFVFPQNYEKSTYEGVIFFEKYFKSRRNVLKKMKGLQKIQIQDDGDLEQFSDPEIFKRIQKKFEVSKKVYKKYDEHGNPLTEDYFSLKNYVQLSAKCCLAYQESMNLIFLNTALKLNDLLISMYEQIPDKSRQLFEAVLKMELEFIQNICNKKGVNYQ